MQRLGLVQALRTTRSSLYDERCRAWTDGRMEVRGIIRELKAAGKTVFFSPTILSDVEALCDGSSCCTKEGKWRRVAWES